MKLTFRIFQRHLFKTSFLAVSFVLFFSFLAVFQITYSMALFNKLQNFQTSPYPDISIRIADAEMLGSTKFDAFYNIYEDITLHKAQDYRSYIVSFVYSLYQLNGSNHIIQGIVVSESIFNLINDVQSSENTCYVSENFFNYTNSENITLFSFNGLLNPYPVLEQNATFNVIPLNNYTEVVYTLIDVFGTHFRSRYQPIDFIISETNFKRFPWLKDKIDYIQFVFYIINDVNSPFINWKRFSKVVAEKSDYVANRFIGLQYLLEWSNQLDIDQYLKSFLLKNEIRYANMQIYVLLLFLPIFVIGSLFVLFDKHNLHSSWHHYLNYMKMRGANPTRVWIHIFALYSLQSVLFISLFFVCLQFLAKIFFHGYLFFNIQILIFGGIFFIIMLSIYGKITLSLVQRHYITTIDVEVTKNNKGKKNTLNILLITILLGLNYVFIEYYDYKTSMSIYSSVSAIVITVFKLTIILFLIILISGRTLLLILPKMWDYLGNLFSKVRQEAILVYRFVKRSFFKKKKVITIAAIFYILISTLSSEVLFMTNYNYLVNVERNFWYPSTIKYTFSLGDMSGYQASQSNEIRNWVALWIISANLDNGEKITLYVINSTQFSLFLKDFIARSNYHAKLFEKHKIDENFAALANNPSIAIISDSLKEKISDPENNTIDVFFTLSSFVKLSLSIFDIGLHLFPIFDGEGQTIRYDSWVIIDYRYYFSNISFYEHANLWLFQLKPQANTELFISKLIVEYGFSASSFIITSYPENAIFHALNMDLDTPIIFWLWISYLIIFSILGVISLVNMFFKDFLCSLKTFALRGVNNKKMVKAMLSSFLLLLANFFVLSALSGIIFGIPIFFTLANFRNMNEYFSPYKLLTINSMMIILPFLLYLLMNLAFIVVMFIKGKKTIKISMTLGHFDGEDSK